MPGRQSAVPRGLSRKRPDSRRRNGPEAAAARALARPSSTGWLTTDAQEIEKRVLRSRAENMEIRNLDAHERFYGTFAVRSEAAVLPYRVEIRSLSTRENSCTCTDFRVNGLGTCKHVEKVLHTLSATWPRLFARASRLGSSKAEVFLRRAGRVEVALASRGQTPAGCRRLLDRYFDGSGRLLGPPDVAGPELIRAIGLSPPRQRERIRLSQDVVDWTRSLERVVEREASRRAYLDDVQAGKRSLRFLSHALYPYQEEGMLHLAFGERVLLADDMGLGKTVQAIAACALLRELRGIERVLVVCPVSLKTEWEEQIRKFTSLPLRLVTGLTPRRREAYRQPAFFNICNYEQVVRDVVDINTTLSPDVVVLDEAQRIKNWSTKTAQAVKKLASPFAFVLTGTPLENRIDEIYSIVEFLDPEVFGPLFRFNREFYTLDERGRPQGYRNLEELRRRLRPVMLRRRKEEVEHQLPERIDNNYFVEMTEAQLGPYAEYEARVARLASVAKRRPLTKEESEKLMRWLACMRMLCDTTYILDRASKVCPKLPELAAVLEDLGLHNGRKALVFSEWERMLELVRDLAGEMGLGYAWHTGSVPQDRRRKEINRFKQDPDCRLFLSTDSGGTGLNLQAASVVVNLDLPWNPARLEQRIARAWRKHQTRPVHVVNLISRGTIEHKMLATLSVKSDLARGLVDGQGDLASLRMASGREEFLERLRLITGSAFAAEVKPGVEESARAAAPPPEDPLERFRLAVLAELPSRIQLLESRSSPAGATTLAVVDTGADQLRPVLERLHRAAGGAGAIEVVDRQMYDALERMIALGLAARAPGPARELHRSSGLIPSGPSPDERRRQRSSAELERASRSARVAGVLETGGFLSEAFVALRDGVEAAVRALAILADGEPAVGAEEAARSAAGPEGSGSSEPGAETPGSPGSGSGEAVAAGRIHSVLVARGLLIEEEAALVSTLRDLAASDALSDAAARRLLQRGRSLIERASETLARSALQA